MEGKQNLALVRIVDDETRPSAVGFQISEVVEHLRPSHNLLPEIVAAFAVVGVSVDKYMNKVEDSSHVSLYCRPQFVHPLLGSHPQMFRLILDSVPFTREGIATMLQFPARGADQILGAEVLLNFAGQTKCPHELAFLDFRKKTDKWV